MKAYWSLKKTAGQSKEYSDGSEGEGVVFSIK